MYLLIRQECQFFYKIKGIIMCRMIIFLVLFAGTSAFGLGSIPNGKYTGKMICIAPDPKFNSQSSLQLKVGDSTMRWETGIPGEEHTNKFLPDSKGFFRINPEQQNGAGYFTENGLHYEIIFSGVPGEDTFMFVDQKLYLISSVTVSDTRIKCEGVFTRPP